MESGRPFFSRRIGLSPAGTPVDIDYGAKLSGRVGRWRVGALAVQQDDYVPLTGTGYDAKALGVVRASLDVLGSRASASSAPPAIPAAMPAIRSMVSTSCS